MHDLLVEWEHSKRDGRDDQSASKKMFVQNRDFVAEYEDTYFGGVPESAFRFLRDAKVTLTCVKNVLLRMPVLHRIMSRQPRKYPKTATNWDYLSLPSEFYSWSVDFLFLKSSVP